MGFEWWIFRETRKLIEAETYRNTVDGMTLSNIIWTASFIHARSLAHFFFDGVQRA